FTDLLNDRIPSKALSDRVVLIGATADSINDLYQTSYDRPDQKFYIAGVTIHANIASQVLNGALDGRPMLRVWNEPLEWIWILAWGLIGSALGWYWYFKHSIKMIISTAIALLSLVGIIYGMFLGGWWIPFIPAALSLILSVIGFLLLAARQLEKQELRHTVQLLLTTIAKQPLVGQTALEYLKKSEKPENQKLIEEILQQSEIDLFN
ncbi:MAG: CHASE2 domain-containing protein, partial [Spirulina sp.]